MASGGKPPVKTEKNEKVTSGGTPPAKTEKVTLGGTPPAKSDSSEKQEKSEKSEKSEKEKSEKSTPSVTIPVTAIYRPQYGHEFYKLPVEPIKYWNQKGIHIGRCLGEGTFAGVYEGRYGEKAELAAGKEKYRGQQFAVKVHHIGYHPYVPGATNKDKIDSETQNEMDFSNRTDISHPNIIVYHFTAEYPPQSKTVCDHVFIFMERAIFPLQELLNCLMKMRSRVPKSVGLKWINGIASGLKHLHKIGVVHNDISPYNILVFGENQEIGNSFRFVNTVMKISDFGKCCLISKDSAKGKSTWRDIERVSLMFISIAERIDFDESVRKNCVDLFNQCFQKKLSFDDLLKSKALIPPKEADEWTIIVSQLV